MLPIIHLASRSEQRLLLLNQMGLPVDVIPQNIDEASFIGGPRQLVARLAEAKMNACLTGRQPLVWALAADTLIDLDGQAFGKPRNRREAAQMLKALSGRAHQVHTGMVIASPDGNRKKTVASTEVRFSRLFQKDLDWLLNSQQWRGAAGAYRIQGRAACLIKKINGSFSNVMGLPINKTYDILNQLDYPFA